MSSHRRELVAIAVLLALLVSYLAGALHVGHSHDSQQSQQNCALCSCASSPALATGHEPIVATIRIGRRIVLPAVPIPQPIASRPRVSPRSPPAV